MDLTGSVDCDKYIRVRIERVCRVERHQKLSWLGCFHARICMLSDSCCCLQFALLFPHDAHNCQARNRWWHPTCASQHRDDHRRIATARKDPLLKVEVKNKFLSISRVSIACLRPLEILTSTVSTKRINNSIFMIFLFSFNKFFHFFSATILVHYMRIFPAFTHSNESEELNKKNSLSSFFYRKYIEVDTADATRQLRDIFKEISF